MAAREDLIPATTPQTTPNDSGSGVAPANSKSRWERLASAKTFPVALSVLAVLLAIRSLWAGWEIDDLIHRSYLLDGTRSALDMFGFLSGDVEHNRALIQSGHIPWWSLEALRIAFFRPLTSLTYWIDHKLWPDSAMLMHAQSLAWFGASVLVAGVLYRRFLGAMWVAGLAGLLFALDDAHATPKP